MCSVVHNSLSSPFEPIDLYFPLVDKNGNGNSKSFKQNFTRYYSVLIVVAVMQNETLRPNSVCLCSPDDSETYVFFFYIFAKFPKFRRSVSIEGERHICQYTSTQPKFQYNASLSVLNSDFVNVCL